MEPNTTSTKTKVTLNLGQLIGNIHIANSPDPNVFPSPEMTNAIFEKEMPRIILLSLVEALATVEWKELGDNIPEVNINLDQLIGTIRYDTEKAHQNEVVEVPDVDMLVDAFTEPLPERKPKSPLQVYPKQVEVSEHGIREYDITKQEILKRVEEILNKVTDRDELDRATIFLRLSVGLDNHLDASQ
jgi:hypothetical protein